MMRSERERRYGVGRRFWKVLGACVVLLLVAAAVSRAAGSLTTWADGDVLHAADLNANFAGLDARLKALEAPASGLLRVHLTANQNLASGATRLDYSRDGVEFDVGQEFDTATDLFTAKAAGYYSLTCNAT